MRNKLMRYFKKITGLSGVCFGFEKSNYTFLSDPSLCVCPWNLEEYVVLYEHVSNEFNIRH